MKNEEVKEKKYATTPQERQQLKKVSQQLNHGDITRIAEACGMTRYYVSSYFLGKRTITPENNIILVAAGEFEKFNKTMKKRLENIKLK